MCVCALEDNGAIQPIQSQQGGCDLVKQEVNLMQFLPESKDFDNTVVNTFNKLGLSFFPPLSVYMFSKFAVECK